MSYYVLHTRFITGYVKKEDAKYVLRGRKNLPIVMSFVVLFIFSMMQFLVGPELEKIAQEANYQAPLYLQARLPVTLIAVALIFIIGIKENDEKKLDKKLKKYKKGEMILIGKLVNNSLQWKIMGVTLLAILYIILSITMPIYTLTS